MRRRPYKSQFITFYLNHDGARGSDVSSLLLKRALALSVLESR
jgi:hypothetical protein